MSAAATADIAAAAARLVVDEGLEYAAAKRKAQRQLRLAGHPLPANEQVEDEVREHLALFHADEQPAELRALRELAAQWMQRLAEFRPHVHGAVWRGTATRLSALHLDLYCDDPKAAEITLINRGVDFDLASQPGDAVEVLALAARCPALGQPVTIFLHVQDHDDLRGALKPDSRGRSWRGDLTALQRLLAAEDEADGRAAGH